MSTCRSGPKGGVVTGLSIVIIGVVLLLAQIGILRIHNVWRFWPAFLIVVGISKVVEATAPAQRIWGGMIALIGGLLLANYFGHFPWGIEQLWPLFVIAGGLAMLIQVYWPKTGQYATAEPGGSLNSVNIFGGTDRKVRDQNFRGGSVFACFGGFQLDLTQAQIEGETAVIEASAVFGGGEIRVPLSWNVVVEGTGIFGGYEDSTLHNPPAGQPLKTLIVRGAAVFGGVEVKN
jgi:hypothetical protein